MYISGAVGIIVGSPLDIVKVRLQARPAPATGSYYSFQNTGELIRGAAAPIFIYGALNGLLFASYNRALLLLHDSPEFPKSLTKIWLAGALGGLATWVVSTPSELIKVRTQLHFSSSSWAATKTLYNAHGIRGLYIGGTITALRDSIGYGFYFWTYAACTGRSSVPNSPTSVLFNGGIAGIATWLSIYPLDVIKTRLQTQTQQLSLLPGNPAPAGMKWHGGLGSWACAKQAYREGGYKVFFDGLGVCMARAFVVNAVQWAVYEYLMRLWRDSEPAPVSPL